MRATFSFASMMVLAGVVFFANVQMGCGVSPEFGTQAKEFKSLQDALHKYKLAQKQEKLPLLKSLRGSTVLDPKIAARAVFPMGQWVGTLTTPQGEERPFSLSIQQSGKLTMAPIKRKGWTLFKVAHACGPYSPAVEMALTVKADGFASGSFTFEGKAATHSNFQNSGLQLKNERGWDLYASIYRNAKTQEKLLIGTIWDKYEKGKKRVKLGSLKLIKQ